MASIAIESVIIPTDRQRKDIGDVTELADSLRRLGQIQPIVINRDNILVAGHRRLSAAKSIGWTHIESVYTDELDPLVLYLIELEENIKRKDLTWQERHEAIIEYHRLRAEQEPDWTQEKTGRAIGIKQNTVAEHLAVDKVKNHPLIKNAETFSSAKNTATRILERQRQDEAGIYTSTGDAYIQPSVIHADFLEWSETYDGPKFNFIHCDFPYGIDSHNSAQNPSGYNDSPTLYWNLLRALSTNLDSFCASSAHMIFWFSPTFYCQTWELLKLLDGFKFDEVPLIWMKDDHRGVAPDTQRRPRRVYEMAFFGWRGDRKLVRMKDNIIAAPTERERHPHEKSETALQYFFEMVVDEQTSILDPTCGSGSAIKVAQSLGARHSLGIEKDEEYFNVARRNVATGQRTSEEGTERDNPAA